jgi:hypothetical protein
MIPPLSLRIGRRWQSRRAFTAAHVAKQHWNHLDEWSVRNSTLQLGLLWHTPFLPEFLLYLLILKQRLAACMLCSKECFQLGRIQAL